MNAPPAARTGEDGRETLEDRRPEVLARAADLVSEAAEDSDRGSWRRCLLQSIDRTLERTRKDIVEDPEDSPLATFSPAGPEREREEGRPGVSK